MNVFSVIGGDAKEITVDNFEKETGHDEPYYQTPGGKLRLYAVCPECGNPIQMINLYYNQMKQNGTGKIVTYAKHAPGAVNGFPYWDFNARENCSLYHPSPLGNVMILHTDQKSLELRDLVLKNKDQIFHDMQGAFGINFSDRLLEKRLDVFIQSEAYAYRAVNRFNLPYAIIRYQPAFSIFGQFIRKNDDGDIITKAIANNSLYYIVDGNGQIIENPNVAEKTDILFYLTRYRNVSGNPSIEIGIDEKIIKGKRNRLLELRIPMKPYIY